MIFNQSKRLLHRAPVKALLLAIGLILLGSSVQAQTITIALQSPDRTYVRAGVTQNTLLAAGSPHIMGWETFTLVRQPDGTFALRCKQNNMYVRAGVGQQSLLAAVSQGVGGWEKFRIIGGPGRYALQSVQNGACVGFEANGSLSARTECISAPVFLFVTIL